MNADPLRRFHFSTEAQWKACLFVQADGDILRAGGGVQPLAAYERQATRFESRGGRSPAVTREGEILWLDDDGCLHRLAACDDEPQVVPAPSSIASATRLVTTAHGLWVAGQSPDALQRYETDTLARILTVDRPGERIIDIADGGRGTLLALVEREGDGDGDGDGDSDGVYHVIRVDSTGHVIETVNLTGIADAKSLVYLRSSERFVVLVACQTSCQTASGEAHERLYWFSKSGGKPLFSRAPAAMRPCFKASVLGSDGRERVFVAGADGAEFGGRAYVLLLDADGSPLGDVPIDPLDAPAIGVTATRNALLVTGPRGLLRFAAASVIPEGARQSHCIVMTPVLSAPDREDRRRWLRIDAAAALPEGSTLEVTFAATDDQETRDRLKRIADDDSETSSQRIATLLNEPGIWHASTVFHGSEARSQSGADPFSAKLFEICERYLWVCVTLNAAAGARVPNLSALDVLYPGRTLMEHLPSIYQRDEDRPDSFQRSLVGVLETTTQGLDARIGALGSYLDPSTASGPWLDFVARWLDLPWDDGLPLDRKRRLLSRAAALAAARGTRAGLELLLDSLLPRSVSGGQRRFRVIDATADSGFATVGGGSCPGSALPAMLGGYTRWRPELDSRAVLGHMRLPCPGQIEDGVWQLAGRIRVEVAATATERKAWEPWLAAMIRDMVPLTTRVDLRWVSPHAVRGDRLDGTVTLDDSGTVTLDAPPAPHLGNGAIAGLARLPERGVRMGTSGPSLSSRLR